MSVSLSDFKAKKEGTALCKLKLWFSYLLTQLEAEVARNSNYVLGKSGNRYVVPQKGCGF